MNAIIETQIAEAVATLQNGGLVAFPTETVYGLGADATSSAAVRAVFHVKGRPLNHPLIVHLADLSQLSDWAVEIPEQAYRLADVFWPGPLTLILKKAPSVLSDVTGGQSTVAVRIPNHPLALALIAQFGRGVVAPSANRFGRISPTTASAVREELGDQAVILDGGACTVGVESTIVDLTAEQPRVLRPGMILQSDLESILKCRVSAGRQSQSPRVSGSHDSHYAPRTPMVLIASDRLEAYLQQAGCQRGRLHVLRLKDMPASPDGYARLLYDTLRRLDQQGFSQLIVEEVPHDPVWSAIRDRLQRASHNHSLPLCQGETEFSIESI